MAGTDNDQDYLQKLASSAPDYHRIHGALRGAVRGPPRVFVSTMSGRDVSSPIDVVHAAQAAVSTKTNAICVIENINREWIAALGPKLNIEPEFFVTYFSNPVPNGPLDVWKLIDESVEEIEGSAKSHYIEGMVSYVKRDPSGSHWHRLAAGIRSCPGEDVSCRTSYCRVSPFLCLFLVDKPLELEGAVFELPEQNTFEPQKWLPQARLMLRLPDTISYKGLSIPQLYRERSFSMFESLQVAFSYDWALCCLLDKGRFAYAIHPKALSYILAASLWHANFSYLDRAIKTIAFRDLRRPSIDINDRLHDLRRDANTLRDEMASISRHIPVGGAVPGTPWGYGWELQSGDKRVVETFIRIESQLPALESFLMDTFQLLMSTISVLDSQASIADAKRGARLTQLATIYVPLSFVTGIFGMNVKEVNNSPLSSWVAVVTLVIVSIITALLLWAMTAFPDPFEPGGDRRRTKAKAFRDPTRGKKEVQSV